MNESPSDPQNPQETKWKPLTRVQRRVFGVLIEKAKTTPDGYPMTLNAITTGCNQKSNRSPQMDLTPDEVESALDELRELGAVAEVQGSGRVPKYRHYAYDWLGVDKVEIAVMAELLLRGEQTVGELRGRAARMEAISDLNALRPVMESLIAKGLVVSLSAEGRGQIVTHALYEPHELRHIQARVASSSGMTPLRAESTGPASAAPAARASATSSERIDELEMQVARLEETVQQFESRLTALEEAREA